jgi:hypothetical protein
MSMANTQTVALQLEKVRSKVPLMYERDDVLFAKIQKSGDVERVSSRNMRIPLQLRPGGKAGHYDPDGGDLGRGSGTTYEVAQVTPIFIRFGVEINKLVEYATGATEKAVQNAAKREVKNSMAQFRSFLDKYIQTAGNGVLASVASTNGTTAHTLAAPHFAQLLYFNQTIVFYEPNLSAVIGSPVEITAIDYEAGTITTANPGATIDPGDLIVVEGLSGANPVGLFGLKYHQSNSATGTWLNLNRANFPEVRTPRVNAGNAHLSPAHVRLALNKVMKALGIKALQGKSVIAYMNVEQAQAWEALGLLISQIIREGSKQTQPDMLFANPGSMGGAQIMPSVNADPTRIDFLCLDQWGRAVMKDIDFFEIGGQTIFTKRGASGGIAAAYLFYYDTGLQIFNQNPRMGSYIDNLQKPAGYL